MLNTLNTIENKIVYSAHCYSHENNILLSILVYSSTFRSIVLGVRLIKYPQILAIKYKHKYSAAPIYLHFYGSPLVPLRVW